MSRSSQLPFSLPLLAAAFLTATSISPATYARSSSDAVAEGYITQVHPPSGFDVNGQRVELAPDTAFGLRNAPVVSGDRLWRERIQPGAYVWVIGSLNGRTKRAEADIVLFRADWDRRLSGLAVIDKVVSAGSEPVLQADGYRIRITKETAVSFLGDLKSLAEVTTNLWIEYEGKRDSDGLLLAAKVRFIPAKPAKVKAIKGLEEFDMKFQPPENGAADGANGAGPREGHVKIGAWKGSHAIPADSVLQGRVRRIGMSLVPAYQKELPAGDPSKIDFRFYAVKADKIRCVVNSYEGLVLISTEAVRRLESDDHLAAVLADGVAFQIQRQAARIVAENRIFWSVEAAGHAASFLLPGVGIATSIANARNASKVNEAMEEQRGRVALALMADAGYDPRQAPEAWRMLAPKKLPTNPSQLKYPDLAGYQLSILNLQYKKPVDALADSR